MTTTRTLISLGEAARRLGLNDENGNPDVLAVVELGGRRDLELTKDAHGHYRVIAESRPEATG
jgi:hypothetical protein